jgi:hypothetical protein
MKGLGVSYVIPALSQEPKPTESPTIQTLIQKVASKDPNAAEDFWGRVQVSSSPFVESMPSKQDYSLVTFLWHGDKNTHNELIASRMPEGVVHCLEVVNVYQHDGELIILMPLCSIHTLRQLIHKERAVCELRERIVVSKVRQLFLRLGKSRDQFLQVYVAFL